MEVPSVQRMHSQLTIWNLAAWLWHNGYIPQVVPSVDPRKADFRFVSSPELDAAVVTFVQGKARVNPASYELLKGQLHQQIRTVLDRGAR